jgi:hypothetical protein
MSSTQKKASKSLCFAFFVILLLIGSTETSQAGTSCASIKKQVLSIEKQVNGKIISLSKYQGLLKWNEPKGNRAYQEYQGLESNLKSIWKLGTNNPGCFTNTQKMLIRDKPFNSEFVYGFLRPATYIFLNPVSSTDFTVGFSQNYKSIYLY